MKITSSSKKSALKLFAFCVIFSMLFMNSAPAIYANAPEEVATEESIPVESVVVEDEIVPEAPLSDLAQEEPEEVTEPEVVVDEVVSRASEATSEVKVAEKELSVVAKDKAIVKTEKATKVIDIAKEVETWTKLGNASYETTESVKLGKTYVYPENSKVQITFTKLPENAKKVTIKELNADSFASLENQVANNKVYEITSAMADGTFEYKLNLPDAGIVSPEIVFSENGNDFAKATTHDLGDKVKTTLNHFTYFAVISGDDHTGSSHSYFNPDEVSALQNSDNVYVGTETRWPRVNEGYNPNRYVQFNFNNADIGDRNLVNVSIDFEYHRTLSSLFSEFFDVHGAKLQLQLADNSWVDIQDMWYNDNYEFDWDRWLFVTNDHSFNIDISSYITDVSQLENLSLRFLAYGSGVIDTPWGQTIIPLKTYFDQVRLDVEATPAAPTITNPIEDSVLINSSNTGSQTIEGTTDPDASVHVLVGGIEKISVIADGSGNFNIPNTKMAMIEIDATDDYWTPKVVTLTASNANGESDPSRAISYQKDTHAPSDVSPLAPLYGSYHPTENVDLDWTDAVDTNQPYDSGIAGYNVSVYRDQAKTDLFYTSPLITPSSISMIKLDDGDYWWDAKSIDNAGNEGQWSYLSKFTVDTVAPNTPTTLGFNTPPEGTPDDRPVDTLCGGITNQNRVAHAWTDESASGAVLYERQWQYPGSSVWQGAEQWIATNTNYRAFGTDEGIEGLWNVRVRAQDVAGNWSEYSDPCSITLDRTAPAQMTLVAPSNNSYLNSMYPAFEWDPNQNTSELAGYEMALYLDGSEYMQITITDPNETQRNNIPLIDGNWQWKMRAIDLAGNFGPWSETWNFTIDTLAPDAPILCLPEDGTITDNPDVNLEWNCVPAFALERSEFSINGLSILTEYYELEVDGTSRGDVYGTNYAETFSEGEHVWRVKAKDMAGNESTWSEMWQFTVDTTAPDAPTLISPANGFETEPADVAFTWTAVDDATEYELTVNGATHYTTDTNLTLNLPEGTYSWKVKAKDSFDRWGAYSSVWGLTLATADEPQDDEDNDDDADDQGTVAGVTDENTEENTINQGTTSSTTTTPTATGTVAGIATFGTGGGADDEATEEEDENKDEEKDGTVLGSDDQDDPNLKAEASSFWDSFKWLLTKWWFWLILIIIILFLWWILGKRRKDDDKKKPLDIDNTPIR